MLCTEMRPIDTIYYVCKLMALAMSVLIQFVCSIIKRQRCFCSPMLSNLLGSQPTSHGSHQCSNRLPLLSVRFTITYQTSEHHDPWLMPTSAFYTFC